jgi:hypothetical protein
MVVDIFVCTIIIPSFLLTDLLKIEKKDVVDLLLLENCTSD